MRFFSLAFLMLTFVSTVRIGQAQQQSAWVPQEIDALEQSASSKSGFSFDHSMLVLASKLDPDNEDLRRVIAGVSGLSVRTYHFRSPSSYDTAALNALNDEYRTAGWKRVVDKGGKSQDSGLTSVWVRMENNAVANVALLLAKPNEVNFVAVSGSISPVDLLHLCGHFGIPKIEGGVTVPNTRAQ